MKKFTILLVAVSALLACTKEQPAEQTTTLSVGMESSKVELDASMQTVWTEGDSLSVFYMSANNECWTYSGKTGARTGEIKYIGFHMPVSADIIGLYPYNLRASLEDGKISTNLPAEQKFVPGSFAPGSAVMAAKSATSDLFFRYAVSVVRLNLIGDAKVRKITLKSALDEPLAGALRIKPGESSVETELLGNEKTVSLSISGQNVQTDSCSYFFCIAPGTYERGFVIDLEYMGGRRHSITYDSKVEMNPGEMLSIRTQSEDVFELSAAFRKTPDDGTSASVNNPFKNKLSLYVFGTLSGGFYLTSDEAEIYPFKFYVQDKTVDGEQKARLVINSTSGLQFGGTDGDYILTPPVAGYRLSRIKLWLSNASILSVTDNPVGVAPAVVPGGEKTEVAGNRPYDITITGSKVYTSYRLTSHKDTDTAFKYITFEYTK